MARRRVPRRHEEPETDPYEEAEAYEEEDEEKEYEDSPRRRRGGGGRDRQRSKSKGGRSNWDDYDNKRRETSGLPERVSFKPDEPKVLRFLDEGPFSVYNRHWIPSAPNTKGLTCLEEDCPLCDEGDNPDTRSCFNVVVLFEDDEPITPETRIWDAPRTVADQLRKFHEDSRRGPLPRHYWEVTQVKGRGNAVTYQYERVDEDELQEDFEVEPLADDEFDELYDQGYDEDQYPRQHEVSVLEEAADSMHRSERRARDDEEEEDEPRRGRRGRGRERSSGGERGGERSGGRRRRR